MAFHYTAGMTYLPDMPPDLELPYGLEHKRMQTPRGPRPQRVRKPKPAPGPRTLQRLSEYGRRKQALDRAERADIVLVPKMIVQVRAAAELNRRDRAERERGLGPKGTSDTQEWNPQRRLGAYRLQNGLAPLTVAQARNLRRRATRTELLELMGRALAGELELRTYRPTPAEIDAWASA